MALAIDSCRPLKMNKIFKVVMMLFSLLWSNSTLSQEPIDSSLLKYTVKLGDVFSKIVQKHTEGTDAYTQVMAVNQSINPDHIAVNQILYFPRNVLKKIATDASVSYVNCKLALSLNGQNKTDLRMGSLLHQDDTVIIPPGCQLDLTFDDHSIIRLPSGGTFKITKLKKNFLEASPEIQIEVQDGRVQASVTKRLQGDATFEVKTPASMTAVRGTEFRVGYQASTGASQTEVSSGVVSARGLEDPAAANVSNQQGVAVSPTGHAGNVEDLPSPPLFVEAQNQQVDDWVFLLFQGQAGSDHYHLRQFKAINALEPLVDEALPKPTYLMTNLSQKAIFFEWTALTRSNLQGDSKLYGVCRPTQIDSDQRCHVKFDLKNLKNAHLKLEFLNGTNKIKDIFDGKGGASPYILIKGLPPGKYRWNINYDINQGKSITKSGVFELIAIKTAVI